MLNDQDCIFLTPKLLEEITGGVWVNGDPDLCFTGVASHGIVGKGNISFAIALDYWRNKKGFDVEVEILKIFKKGASAIVVDRREYCHFFKLPMLVVDDVNESIKQVGMAIREILNPQTILIAGSVGKTGFKTQLSHILQSVSKVHAVINSANVKLPILYSLASLRRDDQVELVEVSGAARYQVGIERSEIIQADMVIFTNISPNHMRVHQSLHNFLKAKASAVVGMRPNGCCLINHDSVFFDDFLKEVTAFRNDLTIITFGEDGGNAYIISKYFNQQRLGWDVKARIEGEIVLYFTPLFQSHAPLQSVGALLLAKRLGYDIQVVSQQYLGLIVFETMGKLYQIRLTNHKKILFYDQSLRGAIQGMRTAIEDLKNIKKNGRVIAVLGGSSTDEDGEFTKYQHEELAELINQSQIDFLYTTGPYLEYMFEKLDHRGQSKLILHTDNRVDIVNLIKEQIEDGDLLFVMGSSYLKLGDIAKRFLNLGSFEQIA